MPELSEIEKKKIDKKTEKIVYIGLKSDMHINPLLKSTMPELNEIKKNVDNQTEKIIYIKSDKITNPLLESSATPEKKQEVCDIFQQIMKKGVNEFKEKSGREMTYSEMREMYG
jgi:hypothetical protein